MRFGTDFWFIVWLMKVIVEIMERLGKDKNEDTPTGQI